MLYSSSQVNKYNLLGQHTVHIFSLIRWTGLSNMSRDTKFSGANVDRKIYVQIPFQRTSSKGNLTRLSLLFYGI